MAALGSLMAMIRTIDWDNERGEVVIIDQTRLPHDEVLLRLRTPEEVAEAISTLRVRGAPALGVAGALGIAVAAVRAAESGADVTAATAAAAAVLGATRPTAVNLARGIALAWG